MIIAQHVIGFTARELGRNVYDPTPQQKEELRATLQKRLKEICDVGCITARRHLPQGHGRSTWEDDLAGDDQYVFLSVGARYLDQIAGATFGLAFDAEDLIRRGAILGLQDLASDYTGIIGEVAEEIAATLPRLPRISDEELGEFMELMGVNDPAMRQFISDKSTDPESELVDAVRDGNTTYPGYSECVTLIKQRIATLHQQKRLSGAAALQRLRHEAENADGWIELLVRDKLPLARVTGYIRAGKITIPCKRCGRPLTNLMSVERGLGPVCIQKVR